jgi:hypothetical protein
MNKSDYLRIQVKRRVAQTAFDMSMTRELVNVISKIDEHEFDDQKVTDVAKQSVQSLKKIKAELSALRADIEGLLNGSTG